MHGTQAPVPLEVVAAITAALSVALDRPAQDILIRRIEPAALPAAYGTTSAWGRAAVLESHLARRQFGLRSR